jgi:tRNA U34 5-methylaminomethyl-2-thiouridine-forming methyltransferase MnmC
VYAPLSAGRAPGGANFWSPSSGRAFAHRAVQSAGEGRLGRALSIAIDRAASNAGELVRAPAAEQAVLALYAALPFAAAIGWRRRPAVQRRYLLALAAGYAAMIGVLFALYVVAQWSGLRYLMVLAVAFLPALGPPPGTPRRAWTPAVLITLAAALAQPGVVRTYDAYKASRQRRQENIAAYVEQRIGPAPISRIALVNGWLFGWKHPGVEVISSLPADGGTLRALERAAWFDYLVLPGDSPLIGEWDARTRYEPVNAAEADAPLRLYRRVR